MSLHLIVKHVESIRVSLWFSVGGIACDVVGCRRGSGPGLVGVAVGVWLSQVGHAARVGVQIFSVTASNSASVGVDVVSGNAVLHTGLTCVRRAIIKDLCAVAASRWGEGERWNRRLDLWQEL